MAERSPRARRSVLAAALAAIVVAGLAWAFWPRPLPVDLAEVTTGPMTLSIREEGRTVVRDDYVVSAPVGARVSRIELEPGDPVRGGETVVAYMLPTDPTVLDPRTRRQAEAAVEATRAAVAAAEAETRRAASERRFTRRELARMTSLREVDAAAERDLDAARRADEASEEAVTAAEARLRAARAELRRAEAMLREPADDQPRLIGNPHPEGALPILSPIDGTVLHVLHESEGVVPAGTPLAEIGDPLGDLEIEVELLSSDAVKVDVGAPVSVEAWGGDEALSGRVQRVEPWGYTKYSALGVEEQRVIAIIRFAGDQSARAKLGHGYRVEAVIEIWRNANAVRVPSSALFRAAQGWAVFQVDGGRAALTPVEIGEDNGFVAEVVQGLPVGASVVVFPSASLSSGQRVVQR